MSRRVGPTRQAPLPEATAETDDEARDQVCATLGRLWSSVYIFYILKAPAAARKPAALAPTRFRGTEIPVDFQSATGPESICLNSRSFLSMLSSPLYYDKLRFSS